MHCCANDHRCDSLTWHSSLSDLASSDCVHTGVQEASANISLIPLCKKKKVSS